jgi:hypothetical protein
MKLTIVSSKKITDNSDDRTSLHVTKYSDGSFTAMLLVWNEDRTAVSAEHLSTRFIKELIDFVKE